MTTELTVPNQAALEKNTGIATEALAVKVTDDATLVQADALVSTLVSMKKEALADLDPIVETAHQTHKKATALRTKYVGPLERAIDYLKTQATTYNRQKEQARLAEQRRLNDEELARQRAAAVTRAQEAAKIGDTQQATAIMHEALAPPPTITIAKEGPKLSSLSFTVRYRADVTDLKAYAKAVADGVLHTDALLGLERKDGRISSSYLDGRATHEKLTLSLPGVRVLQLDGAAGR